MSLQELKEQVFKLHKRDRIALVSAIIESLQEDTKISQSDRSKAIERMRGLLKTDQPAPTDEETPYRLNFEFCPSHFLKQVHSMYSSKADNYRFPIHPYKSIYDSQ
jgi:hypothetical protein